MYMDAKPSRRDIDTDTEMLWVRDSRVLNTAWGRIKKKKKKQLSKFIDTYLSMRTKKSLIH